jgi:hypothetical protein
LLAEHIIVVPSMGDSITEGTLISIEKKVGDSVAQDEVIAVIETDKVNVDIRSAHAGVITEFFPGAEVDADGTFFLNASYINTCYALHCFFLFFFLNSSMFDFF